MSDLRTCRYCRKTERGLIKYGLRAYAHGRCLFTHWTPRDHLFGNMSPRQRAMAVIEALPIGVLGRFRMCDFDREDSKAKVGISAAEFVIYWDRRKTRSAA